MRINKNNITTLELIKLSTALLKILDNGDKKIEKYLKKTKKVNGKYR